MTAFDPARLRALALAATSGPWGSYANEGKGFVYVTRTVSRPGALVHGVLTAPVTFAVTGRPEDAAFMAAASPAAVLDLLAAAEDRAPLYGYFRNPCIHESAAALVSLHATKAGAWRAMRAAMFAAAVEEREFCLRIGGRFGLRGRKTLEDSAYFIQPVTVLP